MDDLQSKELSKEIESIKEKILRLDNQVKVCKKQRQAYVEKLNWFVFKKGRKEELPKAEIIKLRYSLFITSEGVDGVKIIEDTPLIEILIGFNFSNEYLEKIIELPKYESVDRIPATDANGASVSLSLVKETY